MSTSNTRIVELARQIAANTTKVGDYIAANDLPQPSFDVNGPSRSVIPPTELEIGAARQAAIDDCQELRGLLLGPTEYLISYRHNELIAQQVILRFGLAHAFPVGGEATFAELAAKSGLNETNLCRLLRFAMAQHIFYEPRSGTVAHTAASRLLAENEGLYNWLRFSTDDLWRAACCTSDAMAKFPGSEEPNQTGFALSHGSDDSMFGFFSKNPEHLERFSAAMRFFTERPELSPRHIVENYPWGSLAEGSTIVDVGGSHGIISIELARKFPHLRFVVQDLDKPVIRRAEQQRPLDVADRVEYAVHDFFDEQPVNGAEVYLLRAVLHNWSNKYAIKILQSLIPALKPGARVVLNETVIPEPDKILPAQALPLRANDLVMLELQNAGDRELAEWDALFAAAHPGFNFKGGSRPPGSSLWILEAEWMGSRD